MRLLHALGWVLCTCLVLPTLAVAQAPEADLVGLDAGYGIAFRADLGGIDLPAVVRATLVLTIHPDGLPRSWGPAGGLVDAHAIPEEWDEESLPAVEKYPDPAQGAGVQLTWECDPGAPCALRRWEGVYAPEPTAWASHTDGMTGRVVWDVTEDVRAGISSWLLKRAYGEGTVLYYSQESAEAEGDPSLAPQLLLTYDDYYGGDSFGSVSPTLSLLAALGGLVVLANGSRRRDARGSAAARRRPRPSAARRAARPSPSGR